jgi:single-stranded-DNA-specific exonuclease
MLARDGASLFVTSDCGISGHEACSALRDLGADVIVTDHHLPDIVLPDAVSVLDPHLPEWTKFALTGLSGAGVAYLLALALHGHLGIATSPSWGHDLLTLSIAGDGQPVTGINRAWIRSGLSLMAESPRAGIAALLHVAGPSSRTGRKHWKDVTRAVANISGAPAPTARAIIRFRDVTYAWSPAFNAAGMLSDPRLAFELLITSTCIAEDLAAELDSLNKQRKEIEDDLG